MRDSQRKREKPVPVISIAMRLDDHLMFNILLRLPPDSLLICKCVCKSWKGLISDPLFVSEFASRNPQPHVSGIFLQKFLFLEPYPRLEFIALGGLSSAAPDPSLSFIDDPEGVRIRHSCNGLVLCSTFRCLESDRKYYIWKPVEKQFEILPKPMCTTMFGINIAYDPRVSPHYKIICVCDSRLPGKGLSVMVFDSASGSWKVMVHFIVDPEDMLFDRGVLLNGSLHWAGRRKAGLRFNIGRKKMIAMPMPPIHEAWSERRIGYFGKSGGGLYLIEVYGLQVSFDVMQMEEDYSGWFAKYHVDLERLAFEFRLSTNFRFFSVLQLVKRRAGADDQDKSFLLLQVPGKFVKYNCRDGEFMELRDASDEVVTVDRGLEVWYFWEGVYTYTNTLCYL